MDIVQVARERRTVKAYDSARRIPAGIVERLRELLRLAPSSVNSQPWHFVMASTPEGKERIAKAADAGYQYNAPKIRDASHVVVLASRVEPDASHLQAVLAQEERDGRFINDAARTSQDGSRKSYTNLHRFERKDVAHWHEKQTYLALGTLLLGAAALEVGATPMEGFDAAVLDRELGLREKGYTATVIVSFGYGGNDDFNAKLPKSRLAEDVLFTDI
ncbi:oxygen-insensitive NAD(P)H nitroreductase [Massilia sp. YIM B02763]|uniref:oxygen-insensitive NAD(P)H nitroreductase n=1 Tax=Massilia sp. YIM B02763 TaxID=3050130 RepID=UPI0025B655DF|nr:oxygen-insensitive NAD(P)H nitroreductase [Massilia sp. YIM B02763]MDN4051529.1 oxygen-insensitive NAD(P)H nitroreductase [Massilia sp. YIM B02763]